MVNIKNLATSKKTAVIISYISLAVHTLSNMLLTPLYLRFLGLEQYGLYQMVYTVASYILILDFGIKTTMVRYISTYHAKDDYESEKNFAAHCLSLVLFIIFLVIIVGSVINGFLLRIYPTITSEESSVAHQLFFMMIAVICFTILERFFQGCLASYEHFVAFNTVSVIRMLMKIILTIIFLYCGTGVIAITLVDLIVISLATFALAFYAFKVLKFRIKMSKFDITLIITMLSFMSAIFLQSIVGYINNYVDKTILGIMTTKSDVSIYAVATTFVTLFNSLPTAISTVFLPKATRLVNSDSCSRETLTSFVVRPGRYQFIMCAGIIGGFLMFGKEFITLWTGKNTIQAWTIALIIMIPNSIPLVENTIISILDAYKMRLFRSLVLFIISLINVGLSVLLVSKFGMMGAPVGTALAFIIGYGIILNIYYDKKININVISMYKRIVSKTWLCILPPIAVGYMLNRMIPNYSWMGFLVKAIVFVAIYGVLLLLFGFNEQEKKDVSIITYYFRRRKAR